MAKKRTPKTASKSAPAPPAVSPTPPVLSPLESATATTLRAASAGIRFAANVAAGCDDVQAAPDWHYLCLALRDGAGIIEPVEALLKRATRWPPPPFANVARRTWHRLAYDFAGLVAQAVLVEYRPWLVETDQEEHFEAADRPGTHSGEPRRRFMRFWTGERGQAAAADIRARFGGLSPRLLEVRVRHEAISARAVKKAEAAARHPLPSAADDE